MPDLTCQHCGETFVAKRVNTKWCSKRCESAHRRSRTKLVWPLSFDCACCGKQFLAHHRINTKFCSETCRKIARSDRARVQKEKEKLSGIDRWRDWKRKNPEQKRLWAINNPDKVKSSALKCYRKRLRERSVAKIITMKPGEAE